MISQNRTEPPAHAVEDRIPPQDLDAERCVLASCLMLADCIDQVSAIVGEASFYAASHRVIWSQIQSMHADGLPVDTVLLANRLAAHGTLHEVGGLPYLLTILDSVPHAYNATYYARCVREKHTRRRMLDVSRQLLRDAHNETKLDSDVLSVAEQQITELTEGRNEQGAVALSAIVEDAVAQLWSGKPPGLPTGFSDLDELTGGLCPGQLIVLAARPGFGKTALAIAIARNIARTGAAVLFHSLEMSRQEVVERLLAMDSRVPLKVIRGESASSEDRGQVELSANTLQMLPVYTDDTPGVTLSTLAASARTFKRKHDIQAIIVDYMQLIETDDSNLSREQQISQIARRLKVLAKKLAVPVIALAQLNRDVEKRSDKRPMLSDLRESGAIEQDADQVWMLYRAWEAGNGEIDANEGARLMAAYNVTGSAELEHVAEVIVRKNRSGDTGSIALRWEGPCVLFQTLATGHTGINTAGLDEW